MLISLTPQANPLEQQIAELKQTPDHRLTPFDVRIRRLLVNMYELLYDIQIEQRQMHNRLEELSIEIFSVLEDLKTSTKSKKKVE